jgi:hypothetical protein
MNFDSIELICLGMFVIAFVCGFFSAVCVLIWRWHAISQIKKLHYITIVVCFVGALNFICGIGIVETGIMGGRALNGKIEQDQFYLGGGGEYTPVSSATFLICKYYEISILLIIGLSLMAAFITYSMQEEPKETLSSKVIAEIIKGEK